MKEQSSVDTIVASDVQQQELAHLNGSAHVTTVYGCQPVNPDPWNPPGTPVVPFIPQSFPLVQTLDLESRIRDLERRLASAEARIAELERGALPTKVYGVDL